MFNFRPAHTLRSVISCVIQGVIGAPTTSTPPLGDNFRASNLNSAQSYVIDGGNVALYDIVLAGVAGTETVAATLTLSDVAAGSLTVSGGASFNAGVWSLTDTLDNVNAALAAIEYVPAGGYGDDFSIVNVFVWNSLQLSGATIMNEATAPPVNNPPTALNLDGVASYTEDDASVALPNITVSDADVGELLTASSTLSNPAAGSLTISSSATYNAGTGVWTITGNAVDVNAAWAAMSFVPALNFNESFTITNVVDDGDEDASGPLTGVTTVTGTAVNDAPTASNLTSTSAYNQGAASVAITDIAVADVDTGDIVDATLTLQAPTLGVLTTSNGATYNAGTGVWNVSGVVSVVNAALAALAFVPLSTTDTDTIISVSIDDGDEDSSGPLTGTITLDVTPTPPAGTGMALGLNLAPPDYWNRSFPFSNLLLNSTGFEWRQQSVTGNLTFEDGGVYSTVSTDVLWKVLLGTAGDRPDGIPIPMGSYTILNPRNVPIRITGGNFGTNDYSSYSTQDGGTLEITSIPDAYTNIILYAQGDTRDIAVIMPGQLTAWQSGNVWNSEHLAFNAGSNADHYRFMDWNVTNGNFSENWTERTLPGWTTFTNPYEDYGYGGAVPYELMIDLCNRLNKNMYVTIPTRACMNTAYCQALATLINAQLNPGLICIVEPSNETWNGQFYDAHHWPRYLDHTKRYIEMAPNGVFSMVGGGNHPFSNGQQIITMATAGGRSKENSFRLWTVDPNLTVNVINSTTFRVAYNGTNLNADSSNTCQYLAFSPGETTILSTAVGTGRMAVAVEAAMKPILGSKMRMAVGSQSANSGVTAGIFSVSGVEAAVDYVALAPYLHGEYWIGRANVASGSITPQCWSFRGGEGRNMSFYLYPHTTTPRTELEVLEGSGLIGSRLNVGANANAVTAGAAFTGLSNGTQYDLYFIFDAGTQDAPGFRKLDRVTVTVNAGVGEVNKLPDNQDVANTFLMNLDYDTMNRIAGHLTHIGPNVDIFGYEGSQHNDADITDQAAYDAWGACMRSAPMGALFDRDWNTHATVERYAGMTHFQSHNNNWIYPWGLAGRNVDVTDNRYLNFAAQNGDVSRGTRPLATPFNFTLGSAPGSYPAVVGTLPEGDVTYSIIYDPTGVMEINGQQIRITGSAGIVWGSANTHTGFVIGAERNGAFTEVNGSITLGGGGGGGNNAPNATNLTSTAPYNQGDASVPITDIVVSDADSGDIIDATLTLAEPTYGVLTTSNGATYNSGTGVWNVSGVVSVVNAALAALTFEPDAGTDTDTTISVSIDDGDEDSSGPLTGTITLDVTPAPAAPFFSWEAGETGVTRATLSESDGDRTYVDHLSVTRDLPADAFAMPGRRSVRNLVSRSTDIAGAGTPWGTYQVTSFTQTTIDGVLCAEAVTLADGNAAVELNDVIPASDYGDSNYKNVAMVRMRGAVGGEAFRFGFGTSSPAWSGDIVLTDEFKWYAAPRLSLPNNGQISIRNGPSGAVQTFYIAEYAVYDTTDNTNEETPPEYVSRGMGEDHGSGADGFKYFDYENGNTVNPTTGEVTFAQGAAIDPTTMPGIRVEGADNDTDLLFAGLDASNFSPAGTIEVVLTPEFDGALGAVGGLLTLDDTTTDNLLAFDTTAAALRTNDGTNQQSYANVFTANTEVTLTLTFDADSMQLRHGTTTLAESAFDGDWNASGVVTVFKDLVGAASIRSIKAWDYQQDIGTPSGPVVWTPPVDAFGAWNAMEDTPTAVSEHTPAINALSITGATKNGTTQFWDNPTDDAAYDFIAASDPGTLNWSSNSWVIYFPQVAASSYTNGVPIYEWSIANYIRWARGFSNNFEWTGWMGTGVNLGVANAPSSSTPQVSWLHYDHNTNTLTEGTDQTTGNSTSLTIGTDHNPGTNRFLSLDGRGGQIGGYVLLFRNSLSLAEAKALVQECQDALP